MANKMTTDELKTFIFDDLLDFLVETGDTNAVTAQEIAEATDESVNKVMSCMGEMAAENVLESFEDEGETWYCFTEETVERLLEEMTEAGWVSPQDVDYYDDDGEYE